MPCIICSNDRIVNCFGIECCKECKITIAHRPPNFELFSFVDSIYKQEGLTYQVHIKLYRFWYDREGKQIEKTRHDDKYRRSASLCDICCDVICQRQNLVLEMHNLVPSCSYLWMNLLKAWCRWKKKRGRKLNKNPHKRVLYHYGWIVR